MTTSPGEASVVTSVLGNRFDREATRASTVDSPGPATRKVAEAISSPARRLRRGRRVGSMAFNSPATPGRTATKPRASAYQIPGALPVLLDRAIAPAGIRLWRARSEE